ncbi:MAG TPA: DUF1778 domain-containing protein [Candidatus Obscuribacterales bacterium]
MALPAKRLKTQKFDIRLSEEEEALIREAAKIRRTTPTSFIREQSVLAAETVIHEQIRFVLTEQQWQALDAAFGQPPRVLAGLKGKLAEPDDWDED